MKLTDRWMKNFLRNERYAALALAAVVAAAVWTYAPACVAVDSVLRGNRAQVYGALAAIFGSLLGFIIAALAIAIGFANDTRMSPVRQSEHYPTMWRVFTSSIAALGGATAGTLVALIIDRDSKPNWVAFALALGTSLLASIRVYRCVWLLEKMVDVMRRPPPPPAFQG